MTSPSGFGLGAAVVDGRDEMVVVRGDKVTLLRDEVDQAPRNFDELIESWDETITRILQSSTDAPTRPAEEVEYSVPGVGRPAVWCAGANYRDHVTELGFDPEQDGSFHFLVPPTSLSGHAGRIRRPAHTRRFDWEVELAVVIGTQARGVLEEDALRHVAGYTVADDFTARGLRHSIFGVDWTAAKAPDGTTALGPTIVPSRFIVDPQSLDLSLRVNGTVRQQASTADMIISVAAQIAALSALVTLRPGDVILTGSPAGTAARHGDTFLEPGDNVEAHISGIGTLRSHIIGEVQS